MHRALAAQQAGDNVVAEALYRAALTLDPLQPDCLHMLGVVRLLQLDLAGARSLIRQAGELTGWSVPDIRHNYGYLLSTLLSGREPSNLPQRTGLVREQRGARAAARASRMRDPSAPDFTLIIVADGATHPAAVADSLISIAALHARAPQVVLVAPDVSALATVAPSLRPRWQSCDGEATATAIASALTTCDTAFAVLLSPGDLLDASAPAALTRLASCGARWGVARCQSRPDAAATLPPPVLANAFSALACSERVGAALFADILVNRCSSNIVWEREFLLECLAVQPGSVHALVADAIWLDEPACVDDMLLHFAAAASASFWSPDATAADRYLSRALTVQTPSNPLAPGAALDGPGFLKRPLRLGLGKRLSEDTLALLVEHVDSAPATSAALSDGGIEWIGFARAEIGLGESLRLLAGACVADDLPITVVNIPLDMGVRQNNESVNDYIAEQPRYRTRVICANPDTLAEGNFIDGALGLPDAYDIGYWYWELEQMPPSWAAHGAIVDELWVATGFVAAAARRLFDKPVFTVPPPILPARPVRAFSRSEFGLREGDFVFMFSFDMGSFPARKNPEAVIDAFRQAFAPSVHDVALVIKCQRGHTCAAAYAQLHARVAGDPRIRLVEATMTREQLTGLQSVIDSYVSLHRSEGLGLGLAEAMALGKPVIGAGYSGNLDFMNENNSLLVNYHLIPLAADDYLDWRGQHWAAADGDHAAAHMRRLYDDRAFAAALGARGRDTLLREWSPLAAGRRIRARLDAINASLAGRSHMSARARRFSALRGASA